MNIFGFGRNRPPHRREPGRRFLGIRFSTTGASGYSIREEGEEVCRIGWTSLMNPDISISGFGQTLRHREFDDGITLIPGVRRNLTDRSGLVRGYYQYTDRERFEIVAGNAAAQVKRTEHGWDIFSEGILAGRVRRLPEGKRRRFEEDGLDMEVRFLIGIPDTADRVLYPYILAIPVLAFR